MPFALFVLASSAIAAATVAATAWLARRRPPLATAAALAGATALLLFHGLAYFRFFADDAYIILRYSRHFADGLGPNWNASGHVEGYTSFPWMAVLAGMAKLGFDLVFAARLLATLAMVGTFGVVYRIWRLWADDEPDSGIDYPLVLASALLALALSDGVAFWGLSGMETPLFMALLTTSAYLYLREHRHPASFPFSALALAATAMTRPEGLLAVAVTAAFKLAHLSDPAQRPQALRHLLAWAGLFLLLYGSYFGWRWAYYGHLLPNTYYAKVGLTTATLDRGLRYLASSGLQYHLLALLCGTAILFANARLRHDAAYVLALSGMMLAGIVFEGGGDVHGRFIVPFLPLLVLSGLAGFATLLRRAALQPAQAALVASLALGLAGLSLLPNSYDPLLPLGRRAIDERRMLGTWLNENTPPDYTIADFMIGAIAYSGSDRNFLDLLGLNDEVIAHSEIPDMGEGVAGHEKYNADYVFDEARPELIVVGQVHPQPLSATELQQLVRASSLFKASDVILSDPRLWERYQVRAVNLEGRWHHFMQRKDTLAELRARGLR